MDGDSPSTKGRVVQVHRDRVISAFPESYTNLAQIDGKYDFDPRVRHECASERVQNVGLKICKMIVIGDVAVGKTCLVNRFCKKVFDHDYKATIGVDFEVERFEILNAPFTLQMWDTAGQERFQCIAAAYYRGAHIVTIVFDISDTSSLANSKKWLEAAMKENQGSSNMLVFLVGTKKDLVSSSTYKEVEESAIQLANSLNAEYWGVSSKTGENVKEFFFRLAALSFEGAVLRELERREKTPATQIGQGAGINLNTPPTVNKNKKAKCC